MKRLMCWIRGHRWVRFRTLPTRQKEGLWLCTLAASCTRCGEEHSEDRWAFTANCGAMTHIKGGDVTHRVVPERRRHVQ